MRFISKQEAASRAGYHPESWMRLSREGRAPQAVRLAANKIAFVEDEVEAWLEARAAEREVA